MAKFSWGTLLDGLDEGLDLVVDVAAIIPGGQSIAAGAKVIDNVVEAVNDDNGDNEISAKIDSYKEKYAEPLESVETILSAIVASKSEDGSVKIENDDIIKILKIISKSTGNNLDDKAVCMLEAYMKCDK